MKKITLSLLGALGMISAVQGQLNYVVEAPLDNNSTSSFRGPNGTNLHAFQRTVMYISAAEMLPMSLSTINSFSFQYVDGASAPCTGNLTVYMINTNDADYLRGTNWTTAITGMNLCYNGAYTVPGTPGTSTVPVNFSTPFVYTGGAVYVAWDWVSSGPFAAVNATYACNNTKTQCATVDASVTPVGNTLGGSNFRPSLLFGAVNTATTDIGVLNISAQGAIAKAMNAPQTITANVVNSSIGAITNLSVALTVGGANTFTDIQIIPSLAAGAAVPVVFSPFTSTNSGINTVSVTAIINDQKLTNNQRVWTQTVSCTDAGAAVPMAGTGYTVNGYGNTSGTGVIITTKYVPPVNTTLTAIRMIVANYPQNAGGQPIVPTILDNAGAIVYQGNPVATSPSMLGNWTNFNFTLPQALTANTTYYIGGAVTSMSFYPFAVGNNSYTPYFVSPGYYASAITGGAGTLLDDDYIALLGVFSSTDTQIISSASKTLVCKTSPQQVTLTAVGADTYTWNFQGAGNGATALYTPVASGTSTQVTVIGTFTSGALSGCKSNSVAMQFSLALCTGIAENTGAALAQIFPNPTASGKTNVSGLEGTNTITVFNSLGQAVITKSTSSDTESIDLSAFPTGTYLIKITDSANQSKVVKIINQN